MKLTKNSMSFSVFFSCFMPIITHAAAEPSSTHKTITVESKTLTAQEQAIQNKNLYVSAQAGSKYGILNALAAGAEVNFKYDQDMTPLHVAAMYNYEGSIQLLLTHKANINTRDLHSLTPLMSSLLQKNVKITQMLLAAKADIEICDALGKTPLTDLLRANNIDGSKLLIEWGAQPKSKLEYQMYHSIVTQYEENPSAEVTQYKQKITGELNQFIPVKVLADLVVKYLSNLDTQITMNRTTTSKTDTDNTK